MRYKQSCSAFIGDIVKSRSLQGKRLAAHSELEQVLNKINAEFSGAILAKFLITVGDEFQGLLAEASVIPEIIWRLEASFTLGEIRIGIGYGHLDTPLQEFAIGTDGPVWYRARAAIDWAKKNRRLGGSFSGFGIAQDLVLNGIARLTYHTRHDMSRRQREVVALLHEGLNQSEAAKRLSISPQAVNKYMETAGWVAYQEGVTGWKAILEQFDIQREAH